MAATTPQRHAPRGPMELSRVVLYIVAIALAILFLFPIFWSALTSLKPPPEANAAPPTGLPSRITLENYVLLNKYGAGFGRYVYNSSATALMTVIGTILLSTLGGYGFARFHFPTKNVLFVTILATLMIPFQSILTPLFIILRTLHINNTLLGLALVYMTFQLPLGMFLMRNTFEAVPREIEEAGLLDGCSPWTLLYRVMLPLVSPGIVTVAIFTFINAWNEFIAALIFQSTEQRFTLPIALTSIQSGLFGMVNWGALQAGVTVAMIPCLIIFIVLQRYYVEGLTGGAVK